MKRYSIFFLMLLLVSCNKNTESSRQEELSETKNSKLTLSGKIATSNFADMGATAFNVQLMWGESEAESQIFVTEPDNNFQFDNLNEGIYTLRVSKKGYKTVNESFKIGKDKANLPQTITMNTDENAGFTGKVQILGEDGNDISEIRFPRNTVSVSFYLFNGTGSTMSWDIRCLPDEPIYKYIIINEEIELLVSDWVTQIKPSPSGMLQANEIVLIEIVIDPLLYTIKEHSSCKININYNDLYLNLYY